MHEVDERQKLEILLNHWVQHNSGHAQEFAEWAEKSKELWQGKVYENMMQATKRMEEANELLLAALAKLKEE